VDYSSTKERRRELEKKYEGHTVYDNRVGKLGKGDDHFTDLADRQSYIGMKMNFLSTTTCLIPAEIQ
jgi:hypothetical protein